MTNFTFENQGTNTYLVYQVGAEDIVDSMSLGMLTNNKIPGLATAMFTQMDATKYIKYNVSSKVSVKQFFSGAVNKKRLLGVFHGIVDALLSAEDYMIDERTIILDLDYIFADVSSCETVLVCLPIEQVAEVHDLGTFFKGIMFSTQFDQTENCDYVAHIINYLNSTPMFSLNDFKSLLEKEQSSSTTATPTATPVVQKPVSMPQAQPKVQPTTVAQQPTAVKTMVTPTPTVQQKPVVQTPPANVQMPIQTTPPVAPEKKISMFGLLMHYSKENAELYKKQKAAKKASSTVAPTQAPKKVAQQKQQTNPGFAVPGSNGGQGFAIPGQAAPAPQPISQPQPTQNNVQAKQVRSSAPTPQPAFVPRQTPLGQAANFGETTVLGGAAIGETTVLTAAQNPNKIIAPHLIRKKNNEKISLNKPVFRIGKERSYVDYFIGDNTAISRSHANVITREGTYFIVDTNSTNHTFVNGTMINSNEEVQINHGDSIRLANEDFDFKLY